MINARPEERKTLAPHYCGKNRSQQRKQWPTGPKANSLHHTVESLRRRTSCCCSQPVSCMLATVLEWLTDFLTGAIMESRKAARSKAVASAPLKKCFGLVATSPFRDASERASELSLSIPAPCSRVSFPVPLARDLSWYPLNEELGYGFHCIVIIMAQSITSVPIPPKALFLSSADNYFSSRYLRKSGQNCSNSSL